MAAYLLNTRKRQKRLHSKWGGLYWRIRKVELAPIGHIMICGYNSLSWLANSTNVIWCSSLVAASYLSD
ncbi:2-succinyl-5-enolpyruvyl-6-hydroxy-3-cyclohexene-1-carboxylate synthase domain protein [Vibrio parahaemolyticus V-223/04]|nr:2-succinyl-5-enolpyruvyl-6-hydroxy-3-cyclohexene-1-carboxylate synthase domain protein [Vibrio parahaemolyticus V-223/04]